MDYCDRLARVLLDVGVYPARAQDFTADPSFAGLYRDYLWEMMYLMRHIIRASRVLKAVRDAS